MAMADLEGYITRVNPALCAMLGRSAEDIVGHGADDFAHPDDSPASYEVVGDRMLDEGLTTTAVERRFLREDGEVVWAIVDVTLVRTEEGTPQYFFAQMQDITERKRSEEAFEHLALHDPLTGLPNRLLIQDRLAGALARARRHDQRVGDRVRRYRSLQARQRHPRPLGRRSAAHRIGETGLRRHASPRYRRALRRRRVRA